MSIKVYRVEHSEIKTDKYFSGPYFNGVHKMEMWCSDRWMHSGSNHPSIYDDPKLIKQSLKWEFFRKYICGFESVKQLREWFSEKDLKNLKKLGYIIAEYESHDVIKGSYQVIFIPSSSRRILKRIPKNP
jgi:hypothetical protein